MSKPEINKNLININSIVSCLSFNAPNNDTNVIDFLNNLLITDLHTIPENELQFSALCNPKGRIIATFWINIVNSFDVYVFCSKSMNETLLQFFNARKFRLKINIESSTKSLLINNDTNDLQVIENNDKIYQTATLEDFYLYMFNQKLAWIDASNTEKFIPQHLNFDQHEKIMSFTKGCYPGQEIIARIKYLGKIKKRMTTLQHSDKNSLINETNELEKVTPIIYNETNNTYNIQAIKHNN